MSSSKSNRKWKVVALVFSMFGLMAIHNQQLAVNDPEHTYFNKINRTIRILLNSPQDELEEHLVGKGVSCDQSKQLYNNVAEATVVIFADKSMGAGVFIGPRLIATANHVVDGDRILVVLPLVEGHSLAHPGLVFQVDSVERVDEIDLAFIKTKEDYDHWLPLATGDDVDQELMVVGHPNRKYYSLQRARIKHQELIRSSDYIYFDDKEVFFGNSGGAIVECQGKLVGVVSMMTHYNNSNYKKGIGINSRAIADYVDKMKLAS